MAPWQGHWQEASVPCWQLVRNVSCSACGPLSLSTWLPECPWDLAHCPQRRQSERPRASWRLQCLYDLVSTVKHHHCYISLFIRSKSLSTSTFSEKGIGCYSSSTYEVYTHKKTTKDIKAILKPPHSFSPSSSWTKRSSMSCNEMELQDGRGWTPEWPPRAQPPFCPSGTVMWVRNQLLLCWTMSLRDFCLSD